MAEDRTIRTCNRLSLIAAALCVASPAWADRGTDELATYARARAADGDGKVEQAAAGYAAALAGAPDNVAIAERAFRKALEAGDDALVDRAATVLQKAGNPPADLALLAYATAARAKNNAGMSAALGKLADGPFDFLIGPLAAWQALDANEDPFKALDRVKSDPIARIYTSENRALLLISTGRIADGAATLQSLLGADQGSLDLRVNAAQLLAGKGKGALARSILAGDDPLLTGFRASLGNGVQPSAAFGVSRLYTRLAADLARGEPTPLSILFTRAALRAEPGNDRARLLLASSLARLGAGEGALATLAAIPEGSPYRDEAQRARLSILTPADALAAAKALSNRPNGGVDDAARLGDLLVGADLHGEAATAYRLAIQRSGRDPSWTLYLRLAAALDDAGDWPRARAALERAVAIAPDSPFVLNYLGYAQIERGEDIAKSVAMLERANILQPGNASIIDSLAWAYFHRNDAARAVPMLEQAAQVEPANATINEHLGDAYWSLGRRYEARYAWRAAAIVADDDDHIRLARKIAEGLPQRTRAAP